MGSPGHLTMPRSTRPQCPTQGETNHAKRSHGDPIREKRFCGRRPPQTRVQIIGEDSFWGEAIFRILANGEKPFALNIVKSADLPACDRGQVRLQNRMFAKSALAESETIQFTPSRWKKGTPSLPYPGWGGQILPFCSSLSAWARLGRLGAS